MHTTALEVGPRDGLQNETRVLSPEDRIAFITRCVDAGTRRIEAVFFVHPERVPQMAGAEEVMAGVLRRGAPPTAASSSTGAAWTAPLKPGASPLAPAFSGRGALSPEDQALIRALAPDVRQSAAALAERTAPSPTTVRRRLARIERDGLIATAAR